MPTTAAGKAQISGHDVVEVVSEEDLLKKEADKERQENATVLQCGKLVARQSMWSKDEDPSVGTKRLIETTFKTVIVDTRTITQSP